jgi:hypothetical protein
MKVAIVTAEPLGAYHLTPFRFLLTESNDSFFHLLPYDEPTQGLSFNSVVDLDFLHECDKLVVTGGSLTAWSESVALYANSIKLPVVYTELAFIPRTIKPSKKPSFFKDFTAFGELSRSFLSSYLNTDSTGILSGSPALTKLPNVNKNPNRVILFSTDDPSKVDPGLTIFKAGKVLQNLGFEVIVWRHPRGVDADLWEGFPTVTGLDLELISSAIFSFGFIGSATPLTVSVNTPFIGFDPLGARLRELPDFSGLLSSYCRSVKELVASINPIPSPKTREASMHIAPTRDAIDIIWKNWVS